MKIALVHGKSMKRNESRIALPRQLGYSVLGSGKAEDGHDCANCFSHFQLVWFGQHPVLTIESIRRH